MLNEVYKHLNVKLLLKRNKAEFDRETNCLNRIVKYVTR